MAAPTIDYVADWGKRLRGRLYTQFRDAITWQQWCALLGQQFDDLERSAQSLLTLLNIDLSEGANLDLIGRIVGQPRLGASDAVYRQYLRARVLANRSTGTVEEIYLVFRALFSGQRYVYVPGYVKQFVLRVANPITPAEAALAQDFLSDSREAGARAILEWQEHASGDMFTFQVGSALAAAANAGATTLVVHDTSGLAVGGALRLDYGTGTEETVASYVVVDAVTLTVPALAYAHASGCAVEALAATGRGFGLAADDTVGGYSARAAQV